MALLTHRIAANLRARLAWADLRQQDFAEQMGWSRTTCHNKLHGLRPLTGEELGRAAEVLDLADPGLLFSVPPGFNEVSESAWVPLLQMVA